MNWDDLRVAMAVYQTGSYSAAAARLRVDETTVARRMSRLERDLDFPLFNAVEGGRAPTPQGMEILRHAKLMADRAERIAAFGTAGSEVPANTYRIATTDSVAVHVLAPHAAQLLATHPEVTLQFLASTENVNFARWESDLALRLSEPIKGDFIVSRVADLRLYLLQPADLLAHNAPGLLCAYPQELDGTPESQFLERNGLKPTARCLTKNLLVVRRLVESRLCSGILPSFMCADLLEDDTVRATALPETRGVWLLIQPHLKNQRTVRALIDWIKDCFAKADPGMRATERHSSA